MSCLAVVVLEGKEATGEKLLLERNYTKKGGENQLLWEDSGGAAEKKEAKRELLVSLFHKLLTSCKLLKKSCDTEENHFWYAILPCCIQELINQKLAILFISTALVKY